MIASLPFSVANPEIIERINALDDSDEGQELLSIIGRYRNVIGPKSGSVLWADIEEHALPDAADVSDASDGNQLSAGTVRAVLTERESHKQQREHRADHGCAA